jgi:hypothetical protein
VSGLGSALLARGKSPPRWAGPWSACLPGRGRCVRANRQPPTQPSAVPQAVWHEL